MIINRDHTRNCLKQLAMMMFVLLSFLITASSCSYEWIPVSENVEHQLAMQTTTNGVAADDNGVYILEQLPKAGEKSMRLKHRLFGTNADIIVCWNPDCDHDPDRNPDCSALFNSGTILLACENQYILILEQGNRSEWIRSSYESHFELVLQRIDLEKRVRQELFRYKSEPVDNSAYDLKAFCYLNNMVYLNFHIVSHGLEGNQKNIFTDKMAVLDPKGHSLTWLYEKELNSESLGEYIWFISADKDSLWTEDMNYAENTATLRFFPLKDKEFSELLTIRNADDFSPLNLSEEAVYYQMKDSGKSILMQYDPGTGKRTQLLSIPEGFTLHDTIKEIPTLGLLGLITTEPEYRYIYYDLQNDCFLEVPAESLGFWHVMKYIGSDVILERDELQDGAWDNYYYRVPIAEAHDFMIRDLETMESGS
ncbi:MAG: hypothetical protein IJM90_03145 [Firmicutes bacterium]|nr:hypothetical protein [Bacillota bacterium]